MNRLTYQLTGLLAAFTGAALAASSPIGSATARGSLFANHLEVPGVATLFDGSLIETSQASSELRLQSGVKVVLGTRSKGEVHADHFILQQGVAQMEGSSAYRIEASGLLIQPSAPAASAKVSLLGSHQVQVAALTGPVRVRTIQGILIADMQAGNVLDFGAGDAESVSVTSIEGSLTRWQTDKKSERAYLVRDVSTHVLFQVVGCESFDSLVNRSVKVTGTIDRQAVPAGGAAQVLRVKCHDVVAGVAGSGHGVSTRAVVITGVAVSAAATAASLGVATSQSRAAAPLSNP